MQKPELTVPEPKGASLSFCEVSTKSFRYWVDHLPMANLGELSRQLYHAVIELNQLFCSPAQRLQFLELIRPPLRFACTELARHYLGMAIALPEKQRKVANLSQALQIHLANGYKLVISEFCDGPNPDRQRKHMAQACHRALTELGATILRSQQLYTSSPQGSWHESHQIYRFACANRMQDTRVEDRQRQHRTESTIADAYCQILLMGCARANQLRQNELEQAYALFELWAPKVECDRKLASQAVFLVDMEDDKAPVYRSLLPASENSKPLWGFDTSALSEQIQDHLQTPADDDAPRSRGRRQEASRAGLPLIAPLSDTLLVHLGQALALLTQRNFNRLQSDGQLEICAGLTAAHYFIANRTLFNDFLAGESKTTGEKGDNRFMKTARRDAWADAHDAGVSDDRIMMTADTPIDYQKPGAASGSGSNRNTPRAYLTRVVNTSPGGYCVVWGANIPSSLQAGEVLGIREHSSHPWSVAMVRWLRQVRGEGTRVGIEVIAPNATPCGVRLVQKSGNSSEFLRGLLLPEIPGAHVPESLVTPKLPFQTGSRITLFRQGTAELQGLLGNRISATGSVSQFDLRLYNRQQAQDGGSRDDQGGPGAKEDDFDSLWPSL